LAAADVAADDIIFRWLNIDAAIAAMPLRDFRQIFLR